MKRVQEVLDEIEFIEFIGTGEEIIETILPLSEIKNSENALSWCSDKNADNLKALNTKSIIIVSENLNRDFYEGLNCIVVSNPRRTFQEILIKFFYKKRAPNIHSTAIISEKSSIGNNVFIGQNVVIESGCVVGDNSTILHNTILLDNTIIGQNVSIGCNNTIGGIGFGYEKNVLGDFELIPHIGNVLIKNNVDIGNNTCIDRAVLGSTVIENNVKIDNLVHIAHGVKVGRNSVVIANAMVAGSVEIGENCWIAPSASIINKKSVGSDSVVGLGAVVTKKVEDKTVVAGNPARLIRNL